MTSKIRNRLSNTDGVPTYGWTVMWTIQQVEILRSSLLTLLQTTLGERFLPSAPRAKRALRQAALHQLDKDGLLVKVRDDEIMTAFALVKENIDADALDVDLEKQGLVIYDKATQKVSVRGNRVEAERAREVFERYLEIHNNDDIVSIILNFLKSKGAVTMKKTGGVYFVKQGEAIDLLRRFVEGLGTASEFYAYPMADTRAAKAQMLNKVQDELKREFELAAEELKYLSAEDSKARTSTFEARIADFNELKGKVELFTDLLKADARIMERKLTQMQEEVKEALTRNLERHPLASSFPYKARVQYSGSASKKHGNVGTIVGYPDPKWADYVKVLFDQSGQVTEISAKFLKLAASETAAETAAA